MDDGNLKASMNAVHRDVTTYVTELEQRIAQLEQVAIRQETQTSTDQTSSLPSVSTAKKQLDEINEAAEMWQSGQLEKEAAELDAQINDFISRQLPQTVEPFAKNLAEWKTKFNVSMTNAGKQYQELNQSLDLDLSELEKAAKQFANHKRSIAALSRDINSIPAACDALGAELQDMIDTQERELHVSLSGLAQQLQLDIMRAKATTNSTLSQSLSNCQTSSLSEFFATLQGDVNSQCAQMEQNVREVQAMLDTAEKQWQNDVEQLKDEIKTEIAMMRQNSGSEYALQQKMAEAKRKITQISEMIDNM